MKKLLMIAFVVLAPLPAFAADPAPKPDWKPCAKEIKDFACKGGDKAKWQCLEKHDGHLSEACEKLHASLDDAFGK